MVGVIVIVLCHKTFVEREGKEHKGNDELLLRKGVPVGVALHKQRAHNA